MSMNENEVAAVPVRYRIDAGQSQFNVHVVADGLLSMFGHNPAIAICGFGGDVRFNAGTFGAASLLMLVQAASLVVRDKVSDKDRREIERMMRDDVLETTRYPEVMYASANVSARATSEALYDLGINADLTLHGVTRRCPVNAQVSLNGETLRARGEFSLRQSDYNIKPISIAGGTLKVRDELKFSFDIVATKVKDSSQRLN